MSIILFNVMTKVMPACLDTLRRAGRGPALPGALLALLMSVLLTALPSAAQAQSWSADTNPSGGQIGGAAGATLSWGYAIANNDAALWLVTTGVSADVFEHATPLSFFNFPILGPGQAAGIPPNSAFGLYSLTWDATAPLGFVNQGNFVLTAEWWSGDPLAGGSYVSAADSMQLGYSAEVTEVPAIPEPSAALLLCAGLALLGWRHRSSRWVLPDKW
ncbi:hypothetical protein ASC94_07695 [Massilia sp. Root418]|jgi:hypothetical protein|uniref:PEP-CTERM sorting domain-containing protein n=1 Tax=Massilia sp. Root418 TaxID=1736532 RepID=UPI0006F87D56|nr:PEP-CTERM sorting domain-containing protein [Massilia sp. Root418]KQW96705.1 hypothetical protein ASC94_07695 [Massilia sp. Root418]